MLDCLGKTLFLMLYQNQSVPRAGIHGVHRLAGHLHVALEGVRGEASLKMILPSLT